MLIFQATTRKVFKPFQLNLSMIVSQMIERVVMWVVYRNINVVLICFTYFHSPFWSDTFVNTKFSPSIRPEDSSLVRNFSRGSEGASPSGEKRNLNSAVTLSSGVGLNKEQNVMRV